MCEKTHADAALVYAPEILCSETKMGGEGWRRAAGWWSLENMEAGKGSDWNEFLKNLRCREITLRVRNAQCKQCTCAMKVHV